MATDASRDTTTGLVFEKGTVIGRNESKAIDLSQTKLKKYLKTRHIDTKKFWSKGHQPDEAYIVDNRLVVYEKKFQKTSGSVDEKLRGGHYLLEEYQLLGDALGVENVEMVYVLSDYFRKDAYQNDISYMRRHGLTTLHG